MKTIHLHAATNSQGSECSTDMEISPEEWANLSDKEQQELINEFKSDVLDVWVEEGESE